MLPLILKLFKSGEVKIPYPHRKLKLALIGRCGGNVVKVMNINLLSIRILKVQDVHIALVIRCFKGLMILQLLILI